MGNTLNGKLKFILDYINSWDLNYSLLQPFPAVVFVYGFICGLWAICHQDRTEAVTQKTPATIKQNYKQRINRKDVLPDLKCGFSCMAACLAFPWTGEITSLG